MKVMWSSFVGGVCCPASPVLGGGAVFCCFPFLCCAVLLLLLGVVCFLPLPCGCVVFPPLRFGCGCLLAVMLPLSFKIELNTLNKTKQSQTKRSESKVFLKVTSVVSFLSSCVFFSFTFLFSFFDVFCWVVDLWEGHSKGVRFRAKFRLARRSLPSDTMHQPTPR